MYKIILATLALIGTVVVMILVSHPFMILLFREKGEAAVSVFRLLLVAMVFFVGSIPAVSLTIYHLRKPHILTINSILQLVIVVIGNAILIPKFGKFGAAYSLIAAYGITLISTSILAFHYFRKKHAS